MSYSLQDLCTHELIKQIDFLEQYHVLQQLPHSTRLNLIDRLSKRGILTETMLSQLVSSLLTELDLSECLLSDDGSLSCLAKCKQLRTLKMNNRSRSPLAPSAEQNISSGAFLSLLQNWSSLTEIQLRASQFVDDVVLKAIATHCKQVRILNISLCTQVTNEGIVSLSRCSQLFCLNLSSISNVTDEGLVTLSQSPCRHILSELNLAHCAQITDTGIKNLLDCCPRLRILVIHGCPRLTARSRQLLTHQTAQPGSRSRLSQLTWTVYLDEPNLQI